MKTSKFALSLLIVALIVGVGASAFWAGHASSGGSSLEVRTYQPGWANVPWLSDTMPVATALSPIADSVGAVYYLDPDEGWQRYIPGRAEVSNLTTMTFGKAYLMLFTKPLTLELVTQPEDVCTSGECSPCPTPTQCPTPTACPTTTPCPDCGEWQSVAEQCAADYGQCIAALAECTDELGECVGNFGACVTSLDCWRTCHLDLGSCWSDCNFALGSCWSGCHLDLGLCVLTAPSLSMAKSCVDIWDCSYCNDIWDCLYCNDIWDCIYCD